MTERFMIYPMYYREGYGYQINDAKGTDGRVSYWVMIDEKTGERITEVDCCISKNDVIQAMREIAHYLNAEETQVKRLQEMIE